MRTVLLCLLLSFSSCLMAAGFELVAGNGNGNNANSGKAPAAERPLVPYAPWTQTAKLGDFVDRKESSGKTFRYEITELNDKTLTVSVKEPGKDKEINSYRISRVEDKQNAPQRLDFTLGNEELPLKKTANNQCHIGQQTVNCEQWDGMAKGSTMRINDVVCYRELKCQKVVGQGVPLGRIIRLQLARDDGKPMMIDIHKTQSGPIKNTIESMDLKFEVIAFGNTKEKK